MDTTGYLLSLSQGNVAIPPPINDLPTGEKQLIKSMDDIQRARGGGKMALMTKHLDLVLGDEDQIDFETVAPSQVIELLEGADGEEEANQDAADIPDPLTGE